MRVFVFQFIKVGSPTERLTKNIIPFLNEPVLFSIHKSLKTAIPNPPTMNAWDEIIEEIQKTKHPYSQINFRWFKHCTTLYIHR